MLNVITYFLLMVGLLACNSHEQMVSMNTPSTPIEQLEQQALDGNIEAYEALRVAWLDFRPREHSVSIPLIMANKNGYYSAYVDVFYNLLDNYGDGGYKVQDIGKVDKKTREFMIDCLEQAAKGKVNEADSILVEISAIDHGRYYQKKTGSAF